MDMGVGQNPVPWVTSKELVNGCSSHQMNQNLAGKSPWLMVFKQHSWWCLPHRRLLCPSPSGGTWRPSFKPEQSMAYLVIN
jgi:hypothetical protein